MKCDKCGADIPAYNTFCPTCGADLTGESAFYPAPGRPYRESFDNSSFKLNAKDALRNRYWYAFLVCLIEAVLTGFFDIRYVSDYVPRFADTVEFLRSPFFVWLASFTAAVSALTLVYSLFIANAIEAGSSKYFLNNHYGRGEVGDIFYTFKSRHYFQIVGAMAWRSLFQFLWTLLFIIPGIVKAYAYYLVPYILADNPHIGYDRALKLSMAMTYGYKADIFFLQLSFIGWYLLGMLCLGVGVLFVHPYQRAAMAEMYLTLKQIAVKRGICTYEDLTPPPATGI